MNKQAVLIVDDDESWCQLLADLLIDEFEIVQAYNRTEALAKLWQQVPSFHVAVVDVRLVDTDPKDESGLDLIGLLNLHGEYTSSIAITATENTNVVIRAFRDLDISNYFEKGIKFDNKEFREAVRSGGMRAVNEREKNQHKSAETAKNPRDYLLTIDRNQLYTELRNAFNVEELQTLCFNLGIRYDDLSGESLDSKIIDILERCNRHGHLRSLLRECYKSRPNGNWL